MKGFHFHGLLAYIVYLTSLRSAAGSPIYGYDGESKLPSQQCLEVFQQVQAQNQDNGCVPIDKILPVAAQIKLDPANAGPKMTQIADIICQQSPACTPQFLNNFKSNITARCVGDDATNPMVTGSVRLIDNYTPSREMGCLKDPTNGAYCAVEAAEWVIKNHPDPNMQPTKEMCTPCTKGWIEQYDKYSPQYPDLKDDPYLPKLKAVCQSQ
ncbi:hypothetical protein K493DRAFT_297451 [Basidiobolus meristosporus CBS 931.73]|uniref:DUF7729 domain-containing protein n=1 Tax=Basidiobolus meristosporus CBS 931.73 TaxID=1314790 RepID=A0A1Y1Z003_9FUNG|nr:hypothetical protein K493DRAFT_297451 [Basidiobolus meristosporus CBS 931.73]|eukprot:ORY03444.1 hypothetical protein K493DRAFT_297451 [Basidiobolus meristosporus CBS 931.73]